jgi:hypothetical protein
MEMMSMSRLGLRATATEQTFGQIAAIQLIDHLISGATRFDPHHIFQGSGAKKLPAERAIASSARRVAIPRAGARCEIGSR